LDGLEKYYYSGVYIVHDNIPRVVHVGVVNANTFTPASVVLPAQARADMLHAPRTHPRGKREVVSADQRPQWVKEKAERLKQDIAQAQAMQGATMDVFAAQAALPLLNTAKVVVQSPIRNGYGIYEGIVDGEGWKIAGHTLGLALDASPLLIKGTGVISSIPSRLARVIPEEVAGSPTLGRSGSLDVFVVDAADIQNLNSSVELARKLTLLDNNGNLVKGPFRVIEFDTPLEGLAQPFNRSNAGFVNGGRTAGGATEYILPNLQVKDLKNVTQRTIQ
jgi:hypothetical protein